tara:strand:- start:324 stop:3041 length:2718 start_codon:yes stop_codon:yes gene_type:complete
LTTKQVEALFLHPNAGIGTTKIEGDQISTGTIKSNNWGQSFGSIFDLDDGTFYLGGSDEPALSWDGTTLLLGGAEGTVTPDQVSASIAASLASSSAMIGPYTLQSETSSLINPADYSFGVNSSMQLNAGTAGTGLNLTSGYLGYYNSGWKTYMDNSGNFYLGGTDGALRWDAGTDSLMITGDITVVNSESFYMPRAKNEYKIALLASYTSSASPMIWTTNINIISSSFGYTNIFTASQDWYDARYGFPTIGSDPNELFVTGSHPYNGNNIGFPRDWTYSEGMALYVFDYYWGGMSDPELLLNVFDEGKSVLSFADDSPVQANKTGSQGTTWPILKFYNNNGIVGSDIDGLGLATGSGIPNNNLNPIFRDVTTGTGDFSTWAQGSRPATSIKYDLGGGSFAVPLIVGSWSGSDAQPTLGTATNGFKENQFSGSLVYATAAVNPRGGRWVHIHHDFLSEIDGQGTQMRKMVDNIFDFLLKTDIEQEAFQQGITKITGDMVSTGKVQSNNWPTDGTEIDLDAGTIKMGGSSDPKLSWDGETLKIIGEVTITAGALAGASTSSISGSIGPFLGGLSSGVISGSSGISSHGIGIAINSSSISTSNDGEMYIHGFDTGSGRAAEVDAEIFYNGGKYRIPRRQSQYGTVYTHQGIDNGYIVVTTDSGSNPFTANSHGVDVVGAKHTGGTWYYDNNANWVSFTPTSDMCVVGNYSGSGEDGIHYATVTYNAVSLDQANISANIGGSGVTTITGDKVSTGQVQSTNWNNNNAGSMIDLDGGTIHFGGSGSKAGLYFDGTDLNITGQVNCAGLTETLLIVSTSNSSSYFADYNAADEVSLLFDGSGGGVVGTRMILQCAPWNTNANAVKPIGNIQVYGGSVTQSAECTILVECDGVQFTDGQFFNSYGQSGGGAS